MALSGLSPLPPGSHNTSGTRGVLYILLTMEHDPKYTIVIMGKTFALTRSQIEFDSPNYFTTCFLGDFVEAQTRRVELSRDPDLFKVIVRYLCGYSVVPLPERLVPDGMSVTSALADLRADAAFYQLDALVQACDEHLFDQRPAGREKYMALLGMANDQHTNISHSRGIVYCYRGFKLSHSWPTCDLFATDTRLFEGAIGRYLAADISPDQLSKEPFLNLTRPSSPGALEGFAKLRTLAMVQNILRRELGESYRDNYQIAGYGVKHAYSQSYELVILVERISATSR